MIVVVIVVVVVVTVVEGVVAVMVAVAVVVMMIVSQVSHPRVCQPSPHNTPGQPTMCAHRSYLGEGGVGVRVRVIVHDIIDQ